MLVQTEITPNPNSIKFLPGKTVSKKGSFEITKKDETQNELVKNLLSINGVQGIFLSNDFISINKYDGTLKKLPKTTNMSSVMNLSYLLCDNICHSNLKAVKRALKIATIFMGKNLIFLPLGNKFLYSHPSSLIRSSNTSFEIIIMSTSCPSFINFLIVFLKR